MCCKYPGRQSCRRDYVSRLPEILASYWTTEHAALSQCTISWCSSGLSASLLLVYCKCSIAEKRSSLLLFTTNVLQKPRQIDLNIRLYLSTSCYLCLDVFDISSSQSAEWSLQLLMLLLQTFGDPVHCQALVEEYLPASSLQSFPKYSCRPV